MNDQPVFNLPFTPRPFLHSSGATEAQSQSTSQFTQGDFQDLEKKALSTRLAELVKEATQSQKNAGEKLEVLQDEARKLQELELQFELTLAKLKEQQESEAQLRKETEGSSSHTPVDPNSAVEESLSKKLQLASDEARRALQRAEVIKKENEVLKELIRNKEKTRPANFHQEGGKGHIKFKDAVGRKFAFPFHLCCTWSVCITMLYWPLPVTT
jgi:hypothetical protein